MKVSFEFTKTYASEANAVKAVKKAINPKVLDGLTYTVVPVVKEDAIRYGVLFMGESALKAGVFSVFNVAVY